MTEAVTADLVHAELYMLGHMRPEPDIDIGPAPAQLDPRRLTTT